MHKPKVMDVNRLDAHDRLKHITHAQSTDIGQTVESIRLQRPFGDYPFYLFAHARTADDGITKRLIWQPRLTKPKAQTNSMLFKVDPKTDIVKIVWMIPPREQWPLFEKGKMMENETITTSIYDFEHNRKALEAKDPDDLTDEVIDKIYRDLSLAAKGSYKVKLNY
jgi:hypothetical protein